MENNQQTLLDDLRSVDADRALLSFFAPKDRRRSICILDLWNAEIARIKEDVHEPHMGMIRLQWWRDEIRRIYDGGRSQAHPVLGLLSDIIPEFNLSFFQFDQILCGREFEFEERKICSEQEMITYLESVHVPLLQLKSKILKENYEVNDIARHYSIIGCVRSIPYLAQKNCVIFPQISLSHIYPHSKNLMDVVRLICQKIDPGKTPRSSSRYFRATHQLMMLYFKQIQKAEYDPFYIQPVMFKELRVFMRSL